MYAGPQVFYVCLTESLHFLPIWVIRFSSLNLQYFSQNVSGFVFNLLDTFKILDNSSLNAITAQATPNLRVTRPTKTLLGQRFQIKPFSDLFLFWVFPCKHFCKRLSSLKETNTGQMVSLITEDNLGFSLYLLVQFSLWAWHLHQLSLVRGHI